MYRYVTKQVHGQGRYVSKNMAAMYIILRM